VSSRPPPSSTPQATTHFYTPLPTSAPHYPLPHPTHRSVRRAARPRKKADLCTTHVHTHTHTLYNPCTHTLCTTHAHTHTHSVQPMHTHTLYNPCTHTHTLYNPCTHIQTFVQPIHTHTHFVQPMHTHKHTPHPLTHRLACAHYMKLSRTAGGATSQKTHTCRAPIGQLGWWWWWWWL